MDSTEIALLFANILSTVVGFFAGRARERRRHR